MTRYHHKQTTVTNTLNNKLGVSLQSKRGFTPTPSFPVETMVGKESYDTNNNSVFIGKLDVSRALPSARRGFTLIETIIYIAFLSFLLVGVIVSTYPLFTGAERLSARTTQDLETAFVLQKINWMFSSAESISSPPSNATGTELSVSTATSTLTLSSANNAIILSENGGSPTPLSAERVDFTDLVVTHIDHGAGTLPEIQLSFQVNGDPVGPITHYVRVPTP